MVGVQGIGVRMGSVASRHANLLRAPSENRFWLERWKRKFLQGKSSLSEIRSNQSFSKKHVETSPSFFKFHFKFQRTSTHSMEIKKGYTPQYDREAVVYKKMLLPRYLGDFFLKHLLKNVVFGGRVSPPLGAGNIFLGNPETLYDFEGFKNFKSILLSFLDHQFSYSKFPKPRYEFKILNTTS